VQTDTVIVASAAMQVRLKLIYLDELPVYRSAHFISAIKLVPLYTHREENMNLDEKTQEFKVYKYNDKERPALSDDDVAVFIGIGDSSEPAGKNAVVLNWKNTRFKSVSALVAEDDEIGQWRGRIKSSKQVTQVVIEDLSFDTIFSWLLFCARIDGENLSKHKEFDESAWIAYVTAWERGIYLDSDQLSSPACIMSALAHSLPSDNAQLGRGFSTCSELLRSILDDCPTPINSVKSDSGSELLSLAASQLKFERQMYKVALGAGRTFQLLLPPPEPTRPGQVMLVDGFVFEEVNFTGTLKTLARIDKDHAWTGDGFCFIAVLRSKLAGNGSDMTISLDPTKKLWLKDLWLDLEKLEVEGWQADGGRPRNKPRPITSYLFESGEFKPDAPNQPWYDEAGAFTILGAPKCLDDGRPGTKLDWYKDVLPAVWRLYVKKYLDILVNVPTRKLMHQKCVGHFRGHTLQTVGAEALCEFESAFLLTATPTFHAWLAAQANCDQLVDPVQSPFDLPRLSEFSVFELDGGFAVLTPKGVSVFHQRELEQQGALDAVIEGVAGAAEKYQSFLDDYSKEIEAWSDLLSEKEGGIAKSPRKKNLAKELEASLSKVMAAKIAVLKADLAVARLPIGKRAEGLADALMSEWGIRKKRAEVGEMMERLEQIIRTKLDREMAGRQKLYGAIAGGVGAAFAIKELWEPIRDVLTTHPFEWTIKLMRQPNVSVADLQAIADKSILYEWITLGVMAFGILAGICVYVFFRKEPGKH